MKFAYEPKKLSIKLPEKNTVFDLCFDLKKMMWISWTQTTDKYSVNKNLDFSEIIVPTNDSIRNNYFLHKYIKNNTHMLICGPTGTGKTINIINEL
jgi:dynein heavy chain